MANAVRLHWLRRRAVVSRLAAIRLVVAAKAQPEAQRQSFGQLFPPKLSQKLSGTASGDYFRQS
jgi:hypothetical protein